MKRLSLILALAAAVSFAAFGIAWAGAAYTLTTNAVIDEYVDITAGGPGSISFTSSAVDPTATGWFYAGAGYGDGSAYPYFHFASNSANVVCVQTGGTLASGSDRLPTGYRVVYGPGNSPTGYDLWANPGSCYWDMGGGYTLSKAEDTDAHADLKYGPTGGSFVGDTHGWWGDYRFFAQTKGAVEPFHVGSSGDIYPQVAMWRNGVNDVYGNYGCTMAFTFSW